MKEKRLQVFIDGVNNYFTQVNKYEIDVGTPYLCENTNPPACDITGVIGITGPITGCVYFTAPGDLLIHLLQTIEEPDQSLDNQMDLVGEVANTISGNARSEYGPEFNISVPFIIKGIPDEIHLPRDSRSFVIPIDWKEHTAYIVICLRKS
ncbi:MAG: chemotaxis protein CheX [Neisseriaceae bacterium]|nr:chemotaxis protein CheX [Neisseriaceae bacterium]MBR3482764.1 chemotaxis protein CheX [Neisseriaceae bacterium]MBR7002039.1 chemotaxis protein CheX [Neisseriaceae bacterium]